MEQKLLVASVESLNRQSVAFSCIRCNSGFGITNSVKPQSKQDRSFGKTHTIGLFRPASPGK